NTDYSDNIKHDRPRAEIEHEASGNRCQYRCSSTNERKKCECPGQFIARINIPCRRTCDDNTRSPGESLDETQQYKNPDTRCKGERQRRHSIDSQTEHQRFLPAPDITERTEHQLPGCKPDQTRRETHLYK